MNASELNSFELLMNGLARCYPNFKEKLDAETRDEYFNQLQVYSIETVAEAIDRAPGAHPTFYPSAGQVIALCDSILAELREEKKNEPLTTRKEWESVNKCQHDFREELEPDPDGGIIKSFLACKKCPFIRPVFNAKNVNPKVKEHLTLGLAQTPYTQQARVASAAHSSTVKPGVTQWDLEPTKM